MKIFIKDFFSKYDQIRRELRIWSHLPKKSLMENFIFCAVEVLHVALHFFLLRSFYLYTLILTTLMRMF